MVRAFLLEQGSERLIFTFENMRQLGGTRLTKSRLKILG